MPLLQRFYYVGPAWALRETAAQLLKVAKATRPHVTRDSVLCCALRQTMQEKRRCDQDFGASLGILAL